MKKISGYIMLLSFFLAAMSCVDVESELQGEIDGLKERIEILQGRADALNEQLATLGHITSGNVITSVSQDSEGKYVVTYLDSKGESATVVIATMEQMVQEGDIKPEKARITMELIIALHQNFLYEAMLARDTLDTKAHEEKFNRMFEYLLAAGR